MNWAKVYSIIELFILVFFHFKSTSTMALQSLGSLSCRHHQLFNFGFRGRRRREHGKTGREGKWNSNISQGAAAALNRTRF